MGVSLKQAKEKEQQNAAEKVETIAKKCQVAEVRQKQKPESKPSQSNFCKKRSPTQQSCTKELGGVEQRRKIGRMCNQSHLHNRAALVEREVLNSRTEAKEQQ